VPLEIDPRIAELSMGEWEGRFFAEIERDDGPRFARWMEAWETAAPPGGESIATLRARGDAWLDDGGDRVRFAVTHAGVIRAIRVRASRITYAEALRTKVEHLVAEGFEIDG
jgi:alpha-ribazole phosphatase